MRRQEKTVTTNELVYQQATCDSCKRDIPPGKHVNEKWRDGQPIYRLWWSIEQNGLAVASGGQTYVELCLDCWGKHVVPFLRSIGSDVY